MINIGGNPLMILLAIVAALGGVGLYFVRNIRPELARDHDIFFSAIALVYGIIVLAFNFRMEITTQLAQVLVVGFGGWFAVESLVLRQALANQARRGPMPPIVDDDIPPAPNYRPEVDNYPSRRESKARRMRGTDNFNSDRSSELVGDIEESDSPEDIYPSNPEPSRNRRPRRSSPDTPVIDIEESEMRPVHRRPRRADNRSGTSSDIKADSRSEKGSRRRGERNNSSPVVSRELDDF